MSALAGDSVGRANWVRARFPYLEEIRHRRIDFVYEFLVFFEFITGFVPEGGPLDPEGVHSDGNGPDVRLVHHGPLVIPAEEPDVVILGVGVAVSGLNDPNDFGWPK